MTKYSGWYVATKQTAIRSQCLDTIATGVPLAESCEGPVNQCTCGLKTEKRITDNEYLIAELLHCF